MSSVVFFFFFTILFPAVADRPLQGACDCCFAASNTVQCSLYLLLRYQVEHKKRNSISLRAHILFSMH